MLISCNTVCNSVSTAGTDYNSSRTEFEFEGAPQQMCVEIDIFDDDLLDPRESFLVILNTTLTNRTVSLNPQYAFVTIADNERKLKVWGTNPKIPGFCCFGGNICWSPYRLGLQKWISNAWDIYDGSYRISNPLAQTKGSVVYWHMYWSPAVPCPPDSLFVHTSLKTVMHEGLEINWNIHL